MATGFLTHPEDATFSVTRAARVLGVHPNTIRAWSDQGHLRYYRINTRGDRRYRMVDLQRFLNTAERDLGSGPAPVPLPARQSDAAVRAAAGARATAAAYTPLSRVERGGRMHRPQPLPGFLEGRLDAGTDRSVPHGDLGLLTDLAGLAVGEGDFDRRLAAAVRRIREWRGYVAVSVWELRDERLVRRTADGVSAAQRSVLARSEGTPGQALLKDATVLDEDEGRPGQGWLATSAGLHAEAAAPIRVQGRPWGVLLIGMDRPGLLDAGDLELLTAAAAQISVAVYSAGLLEEAAHELHRAEALRRVASDIGAELDLDEALARLIDHAMLLFAADRGAVFLRERDGHLTARVSHGLSDGFLTAVRNIPSPSVDAEAIVARMPVFVNDYQRDPRGAPVRIALVQEGFDTICAAPLFDGQELLGLLNLYHDRPHAWTPSELETIAAFAAQASTIIRSALQFGRLAGWAAQMQSIQQLGSRLNRLTDVREIGLAIATEFRQLIQYDSVRVYQRQGDDLIPVALLGWTEEYEGETAESLRTKVGRGITGWVAEHGIAQNLTDAESDERGSRIPGTDPIDESMLLAPMLFEDAVLGVIVLTRHGLAQFDDDDLRLLAIYASFAAQAMAHAEATERLREQSAALERQLRSQRELLQITESILTTMDPHAVLDQIAERLGVVVGYDNLAIEVVDPLTRVLAPLVARGIHAATNLEPWDPDESGLATWVVEHNEPALVIDVVADPRASRIRVAKVGGSLIVVPLRGREGATGVLTLERSGDGDAYTEGEFELVKLFAAQVSIALQNAEVYRAIEVRARTDNLTGLLNHGTFTEWLSSSVARGEPFSLVMMDLDDFKGVNDALGHQAGDRLLSHISAAIVATARHGDAVFRYGGDEFALLLPGTTTDGALLVADRLLGAVRSVGLGSVSRHRRHPTVTASIGIASFGDDATTAETMLLAADRACFVAKRTGRDRVATAAQGLVLAAEFSLQEPTPVDSPRPAA